MIVPLPIQSHGGGVNRAHSEDEVPPGQVLAAQNGRTGLYGSVGKRDSTQRLHTTAIGSGAAIMGEVQWEPADYATNGAQIVAVSNGLLYHKRVGDAEFTEKPLGATTTAYAKFVVSRLDGAATLYVVVGGEMWSFDGGDNSTPLQITAIPAGFVQAANYHGRMFARWERFLYWTGINLPESWDIESGGNVARIETFDMEDLNGLMVIAGALLMFKRNSISRFMGYDIADIQIDTETEGVSPDVGLAASEALVRMEDVAFFLSDRGPYMATNSAYKAVGEVVEFLWDKIDATLVGESVAYHNRRRREAGLVIPVKQDDGTSRWEGWRYNYRTHTWWGPDIWPFRIMSASRYERADGTESVMFGCDDGFLRDADVERTTCRDDVLADGTGGTPIPLSVSYPDATFGMPSRTKMLYVPQDISADLGYEGQLVMDWESEVGKWQTIVDTKGNGLQDYRVRPPTTGKRISLTVSEYTDQPVRINSITLNARLGRARP